MLGAPRERFTADELKDVKDFVANGGSLAVFVCEGGFFFYSHQNSARVPRVLSRGSALFSLEFLTTFVSPCVVSLIQSTRFR